MDYISFGGATLGVLGGAAGTYFSIKNTAGARERAFTIRASALLWFAVVAFLAGFRLTPAVSRPLVFLSYTLLLSFAILSWNRGQDRIRREEAA